MKCWMDNVRDWTGKRDSELVRTVGTRIAWRMLSQDFHGSSTTTPVMRMMMMMYICSHMHPDPQYYEKGWQKTKNLIWPPGKFRVSRLTTFTCPGGFQLVWGNRTRDFATPDYQ